MFHLGRSGSTVLGDLLAQHPRVLWDGEIYEWALRDWEKRHGRTARRQDCAFDARQELARRLSRLRAPIYGFETKFFQIELGNVELADYVNLAVDLGVTHFVILERRNLMRVIVSAAIADMTEHYHNASHQRAREQKVHLDVEAVAINRDSKPLLTFLNDYQQSMAEVSQLLSAQPRVLHLSYEDDVAADPQVGYRRLCQFLGIEPMASTVRFSKTTPFPLARVIANIDEVEHALEGTEFAAMLRD